MRNGIKMNRKYKLVAQTPSHTFVYRWNNDKQVLEDLAIKVSITKPEWKLLVVASSFAI